MTNVVSRTFPVQFRKRVEVLVPSIDPATKEPRLDGEGKPVMVKSMEKARENFTVAVPVPTQAGILHLLANGSPAVKELICDSVYKQIAAAIQLQTHAETNPVTCTAELDMAKLDLEAIATQPAADRGGKYKWEEQEIADFTASYVAVMSAAGHSDSVQATASATAFTSNFSKYKTNRDILLRLQDRLNQFIGAADSVTLEKFDDALSNLDELLTGYLKTDSASFF